ncbi:MAG: DUF1385 domain-containing protein [Clostridiaceae bacterium]|nr:DUF1385 domain-containing protein [Clostridiaceae bacterium]
MKKTMNKQDKLVCRRKTTIGGQALIEGLMMIGPEKKAMAVRKPDGKIMVEELPMTRFTGAANLLFVRGSVRLFRQLVSGTKALLRSAEFVEDDQPPVNPASVQESLNAADEQPFADKQPDPADPEKQPPAKESFGKKLSGRVDRFLEKHSSLMLYGSAVVGILFSVVLFILLPNFLTSFIKQLTRLNDYTGRGATVLFNLIEGLIRIVIFVGYLALASRMKDIRRVWMYHGAEHKTISCYEAEQELTVENARLYSRFHPRCGTAFMFIVILVSIIVFSLVGWWGRWVNLLIRFALVPVVAGIAYEIIRLAGRYDNILTRAISAPGLWLQRLTTAEPDDSMLEVAISALNAVIPEKALSDRW